MERIEFEQYEAGYLAFIECLRTNGVYFEEMGLDPQSRQFGYGTEAPADLGEFTDLGDPCYQQHFADLDLAWQIQQKRDRDASMGQIGELQLTRVLYVDIPIPAETVGLNAAEIANVSWNDERWAAGGEVMVGAAAWVIGHDDQVVVLDPFQAADEIFHAAEDTAAHQQAIIAAFDAAGTPIETVTRIVLTHLEGIGLVAVRDVESGRWRPFFPHAKISLSQTSLDNFITQPFEHFSSDAWQALLELGIVDTYAEGDEIVPQMIAGLANGHDPGHYVLHLGEGPTATFVGHLALSPLHLTTGPCAQMHADADLAWSQLLALAGDGRMLIGPLWPSPGMGRYQGGTFTV